MLTYLGIAVAMFIAGVVALIKYRAFSIQTEYPFIEPLEEPKLPVESVPLPEKEIPPAMPKLTKREHLYDTAYDSIGIDMSPQDKAPDALGCMESLDGVYLAAFGEHLLMPADRLSTARGYAAMRVNPNLELIKNEDAGFGDIVISPSGMSTKNSKHGHCGIRGHNAYMSNDSDTGKWLSNYNIPNWKLVFADTLGFPIFHFRVRGDVV